MPAGLSPVGSSQSGYIPGWSKSPLRSLLQRPAPLPQFHLLQTPASIQTMIGPASNSTLPLGRPSVPPTPRLPALARKRPRPRPLALKQVGGSTWKGFTSTGSAKGLVSKADMVIGGRRAISASATALEHSDPAALSVDPPLPGARQPFWRRRRALCGGVVLCRHRGPLRPLPSPLESDG